MLTLKLIQFGQVQKLQPEVAEQVITRIGAGVIADAWRLEVAPVGATQPGEAGKSLVVEIEQRAFTQLPVAGSFAGSSGAEHNRPAPPAAFAIRIRLSESS